jgi:hypothetical protein
LIYLTGQARRSCGARLAELQDARAFRAGRDPRRHSAGSDRSAAGTPLAAPCRKSYCFVRSVRLLRAAYDHGKTKIPTKRRNVAMKTYQGVIGLTLLLAAIRNQPASFGSHTRGVARFHLDSGSRCRAFPADSERNEPCNGSCRSARTYRSLRRSDVRVGLGRCCRRPAGRACCRRLGRRAVRARRCRSADRDSASGDKSQT